MLIVMIIFNMQNTSNNTITPNNNTITPGNTIITSENIKPLIPIIPTETTRGSLMKKCPIDPNANGMINVGNSAMYEDYLFSACQDADTCENPVSMADPISSTLINSSTHCGAWLIDAPGYNSYTWNQTEKKWKNR